MAGFGGRSASIGSANPPNRRTTDDSAHHGYRGRVDENDAWTRTTRTRLHTRGFMVVFDVDDHGSEVVALMGIGRAGTTIASDI